MELLGNLFLLFCIGLAAYEFILKPLHITIRVGPMIDDLTDAIRSALPPVGRFVHWLIVGQPRQVSRVLPISEPLNNSSNESANLTECDEEPERTNERERSVLFLAAERLQLDRSRSALIAVLIEAGWQTVDIRNTLKGTASDLGDEIRTARAGLAGDDLLLVRDGKSERLIVK